MANQALSLMPSDYPASIEKTIPKVAVSHIPSTKRLISCENTLISDGFRLKKAELQSSTSFLEHHLTVSSVLLKISVSSESIRSDKGKINTALAARKYAIFINVLTK